MYTSKIDTGKYLTQCSRFVFRVVIDLKTLSEGICTVSQVPSTVKCSPTIAFTQHEQAEPKKKGRRRRIKEEKKTQESSKQV